jgi:hypothetical protein
MSDKNRLNQTFISSTDPDADDAVFVHSQTYVDGFAGSTLSKYDESGPTRLGVVTDDHNRLKEFTYTHMATIAPSITDEEAKAVLLQGEAGEIVWRGPKTKVYYNGPADKYLPPDHTPIFCF